MITFQLISIKHSGRLRQLLGIKISIQLVDYCNKIDTR